jgi:hypothetical protein
MKLSGLVLFAFQPNDVGALDEPCRNVQQLRLTERLGE